MQFRSSKILDTSTDIQLNEMKEVDMGPSRWWVQFSQPMWFSDLCELLGSGGVRPGSGDLVSGPHDRNVLSRWMMVEHNHLRNKSK